MMSPKAEPTAFSIDHDPVGRHLGGEVDQHGMACDGVRDAVAACSAVDHEIRAAGAAR
jgi:hypothetical protein